MGYLPTEKYKTTISPVLSIVIVITIIQAMTYYSEHNLVLGSLDENLMVPTPVAGSDYLIYDDAISGFSIEYPSNWDRVQGLDRLTTFNAPRESFSDPYPATLGVSFEVSNMSLPSIAQTHSDNLNSQYTDIDVLESSEITFLGFPAHRMVFTATDETQNLKKEVQVWFKEDDKVYKITYKAPEEKFSQYLPTVQNMLNSFKIRGE